MRAGEEVSIDTGANREFDTIQNVGTAGANGTGLTLATALNLAHAARVTGQDLGTGPTPPTRPDMAHPLGTQVTRRARGLLPGGPQGEYVMVANRDQTGLESPAFHWGPQHYLNDIVGGGVAPWYTNINAVPLSPTPISPAPSDAWARILKTQPA